MKEEFTDKTENPSLIKILAHGLVWAFLLLFPLPYFGMNSSYFLQTLLQSLLLATLFYFNLYSLIPRYLSKSRALHYFVILLGASALIIVISESVNMMFEPVIAPVSLPGPPPYSPADAGPLQMLPFLLPTILKTILVVAISICFALLDDYFERDKQKNEQANRKLNDELAILKLQINPHFFFNTLNSIYFLARHKSDQTAGAVLKLSDLMRYIIYDSARPKVALTQELEYIRNYIQIQQLRLHERNHVNYSETGAFDNVMIEPLLLLPFIENAFKHGISPEEDTVIDIHVTLKDHALMMQVDNPVISDQLPENKGGIGLANIRKRLSLLYPGRHELDAGEQDGRYRVNLKILISDNELHYS